MRVLYSFPNKIGADRVCYTAWEQVKGLCANGVEVLLMPGAVHRPIPGNPQIEPTLSRGRYRLPYKLLRRSAFYLHDWIVARRLEKLAGQIDLVHCWPSASLETLRTAKRLGIPTVLERPNAHTRFCYETVQQECKRLGVTPHAENSFKANVLKREEAEFAAADFLLCPSNFVADSFLAHGFSETRILRHMYGFDENTFFPDTMRREKQKKFIALFVGVDAVRKGLHLALESWLLSPLIKDGIFMIAGELTPEFKRRFKEDLSDPSVVQLGFRKDVPHLMRKADVLVLPTFEEGSPLVCSEALGAGLVPLTSTVCAGVCQHMENSLIHEVGDVAKLREHFTMLYRNPELLAQLRQGAIRSRYDLTWTAAGKSLATAYAQATDQFRHSAHPSVCG